MKFNLYQKNYLLQIAISKYNLEKNSLYGFKYHKLPNNVVIWYYKTQNTDRHDFSIFLTLEQQSELFFLGKRLPN